MVVTKLTTPTLTGNSSHVHESCDRVHGILIPDFVRRYSQAVVISQLLVMPVTLSPLPSRDRSTDLNISLK